MPAIITINDNYLQIQQGESIATSHGFAWLKDGDVYFDDDAQNKAIRHSRLMPQQINSQYWQQCAQTSISQNDAGMRHAADLIWRHLTQLKQTHNLDEVVFVVPSHYQANNLQLLLGIAKSCGLTVFGLINKAILALHNKVDEAGQYLHIDLQLHQTVATTVQADAGVLRLRDIDVLHNVSIQAIQDSLLKTIQQRFIQSDRFDPLHYAETEQQLFDQIPAAVSSIINQGKANLVVDHQSRTHNISLDKNQLQDVLVPFLTQLYSANADQQPIQRFVKLNNIFDGVVPPQLAEQDLLVVNQAEPIKLDQITLSTRDDNEVIYTTELPLQTVANSKNHIKPPKPEVATQVISNGGAANSSATHLLQGGLAVPISNAHISMANNQLLLSHEPSSNAQDLLHSNKVFILNDPERNTLKPDDRLGSNLADGAIIVIQVVG